jgi:hypothetical protein
MWYKSSLLTNKSPLTKQTKTQLAQISFNSKCLFLIDDVIFIYYAMNDLTNVGIPLLITVCYIKEVHKRHALLYISLIITNQWCYQCVSLHVSHIKLGYLVLLKQCYLWFIYHLIYSTYNLFYLFKFKTNPPLLPFDYWDCWFFSNYSQACFSDHLY